ncbi:MAG: MmcQ/YjbR family DNA-binding protein [Bacteroidia bacterium]
MISNTNFKKLVLSFPESIETPHRDMFCYKIKGKIFVTHNKKENRCCVRLSQEEQPLFCMIDAKLIYAVPNKWGNYGWTLVNLKAIDMEMLMEVLTAAYSTVAPPKLAEPFLKHIDSF